jgi:hypothetical protein
MKQLPTLLAVLALTTTPALAQEAETPSLSIELNAQASSATGCLLTFMASNGHAEEIESAVFETVLFDKDGQVDRLTLFDFGSLPAGRPRVRQFQVEGLSCDALGQVLINGANSCKAGGADSALCGTLELNSRTDVELIG